MRAFTKKVTHVAVALYMPFVASGCGLLPESSFKLAPDSRLPKWFTAPPGVSRSHVTVSMDYYDSPWKGGSATFKLLGPNGDVLAKFSGVLPQKDPKVQFSYPSYEVITINGVTDIVEHIKMEPIFYMTDDPTVWNELAPKR